MKICSNAEQLRNALNEIKPTKIAVAYVGAGWEKYILLKHLKEIIVSPTLGSNPKAIKEIMDKIGVDNVHFLDNLHSKLYLGKQSALLGSSNLSKNGFHDSGKFEAGVVLNASLSLKKLDDIFEGYKEQAIKDYPTPESKIEKLKQLIKLWQIAIWHGVDTACNDEESPSIGAYEPSHLNRIHIAWYTAGVPDYNEEEIGAKIPDAIGVSPNEYFSSMNSFHSNSLVRAGDWILNWQSNNDGSPRMRGDNIYWVHVHHVVPNGIRNEYYPMLAGQAEERKCPPLPFDLDDRTIQLIREALRSGQFPELLSTYDDPWQLEPADEVVPEFLNYIKKQYITQAA
jgi:hypothetical protein